MNSDLVHSPLTIRFMLYLRMLVWSLMPAIIPKQLLKELSFFFKHFEQNCLRVLF